VPAGLLLAALALGLVCYSLLPGRRSPGDNHPEGRSPDPRLEYAGPFRNIDPSVRYVAEEKCAGCHADKALTYAEHPMGRSLLPVAAAVGPPEDAGHHNPFTALGDRYLIRRQGDQVWHRRTRLDPSGAPAAELEWEVHYVIGSGNHGHSYLTDRGGYLFQTPVSWYEQKQVWDLSPGFGPDRVRGRPVVADCLFCHANRARSRAHSVNAYEEPIFDGHAIGCQRCHGPGELHVAGREKTRPDHTIVNPGRLERPLRDAVCEQCHLEGAARVLRRGRGLYDFRPGLPLDLFWSVLVRAAGDAAGEKAVGHVEQMYQSRCFRGGTAGGGGYPRRDKPGGSLGCVSCHNPHERVAPEGRVAHYRERCLRCHEQHGCSLPPAERRRRTADDSCIACHMPRYGAADVPHTASTDHRILKDPQKPGREEQAPAAAPGGRPFVLFNPDRAGGEGEHDRDRAVGIVNLAVGGDPVAARAVRAALPHLEAAVKKDPDDLPAREALGYALMLQGRPSEALAAFRALLARSPDHELALVGAAATAETLGRVEDALGYWQRAIAVDPWVAGSRRSRTLLLVKEQAWDEALPECEAWLRLDPMSAEGRATRVSCLLAAGNKEEARAEFARLEALAPDNLPELQARFARRLK
jgi:tetratricopeptide (TPR) repeat protein